MSRRRYPPEEGGLVNPWRLTKEQQEKLAKQLVQRGLDEEDCRRFLISVSEWVDTVEDMGFTPAKGKLEKVRNEIRRLQGALNGLDDGTLDLISCHFDALIFCTTPEVDLPELRRTRPGFLDWLERNREALDELDAVIGYACGKVPSSNDRTSKQRDRLLASGVVLSYVNAFGVKPPKSDWFYNFMEELGKESGFKLGRNIVKNAINSPVVQELKIS